MFSPTIHAGIAQHAPCRRGSLLGRFLELLALWAARSHERRMLASFDERGLRDLGLNRAEAELEAGKAFWET